MAFAVMAGLKKNTHNSVHKLFVL